jgi:hypothetical protein
MHHDLQACSEATFYISGRIWEIENLWNTSSMQMFLGISTGQAEHTVWSLHHLIFPSQILCSWEAASRIKYIGPTYHKPLMKYDVQILATTAITLHEVNTQNICDTTKSGGEIMSATVSFTTYFLLHSLLRYYCSEVQPNIENPLHNLFVL